MTCMNRRILDSLLAGVHRSKSGYLQLHQAFAIEWATKGEVPAYLWLEDPYVEARIRASHASNAKDFETRIKGHVLKWNSLKTADGMLREKARVLSRLFNVQWAEVKSRAWHMADEKAQKERADISYLLAPDDFGPDTNGVYHTARYPEMDDETWFLKILEDASNAGHRRCNSNPGTAPRGPAIDLEDLKGGSPKVP